MAACRWPTRPSAAPPHALRPKALRPFMLRSKSTERGNNSRLHRLACLGTLPGNKAGRRSRDSSEKNKGLSAAYTSPLMCEGICLVGVESCSLELQHHGLAYECRFDGDDDVRLAWRWDVSASAGQASAGKHADSMHCGLPIRFPYAFFTDFMHPVMPLHPNCLFHFPPHPAPLHYGRFSGPFTSDHDMHTMAESRIR